MRTGAGRSELYALPESPLSLETCLDLLHNLGL
jgi:hypothetical protein